jgi:hypothetical protein
MTRDKDALTRVTHAGEDVLKRLFDVPRRIVIGALDEVEGGLHHISDRLRSMDPLDSRVAAIEKRLDSLEKPARTTARRSTSSPKRPAPARPSPAAAAEPTRSPAATPAGAPGQSTPAS